MSSLVEMYWLWFTNLSEWVGTKSRYCYNYYLHEILSLQKGFVYEEND